MSELVTGRSAAMLLELDERMAAECSSLEPVYVDGLAGVTNLGANFGMVFFRHQPVCYPGAGVHYEQVPALYVVRPKASIVLHCTKTCPFRQAIEQQRLPHGLVGGH